MSDPVVTVRGVDIKDVLGEGAFGKVYRARHLTLDVDVAVKVVAAQPGTPSLDDALKEARLMARLDHPNLLRIHDAGRLDAGIYLIMELMDGSCDRVRRLPAATAESSTRQLLSGLQALHDARILHRDIKPANCLTRARDGRLKLADLGIAVEQATQTGRVYDTAGTLPFMAPELFESPPHFAATSDLYALGMSFACMFLDAKPYPSGKSFAEMVSWIRQGDRTAIRTSRPDLQPALTMLVDRMCAIDATKRPASATDALALLAPETIRVPSRDEDTTRVRTVGPWLLGEEVRSSPNWTGFIATHSRTGTAARFTHLQPESPLAQASELILASAERASRLRHASILDVLDWGTHDGRPYVVTAPQGRTLQELIKSGGPLDEVDALKFAYGLADALVYLHQMGLVYQVVDPGSVVITQDARSAQLSWPVFCVPAGTPAIADTGERRRVFVAYYAAPEAIIDYAGTIDYGVDIYGIGIVLYTLLAGKHPHRGVMQELIAQKMAPVEDLRARAPMVTAPTAQLVRQLLQPRAGERPKSAEIIRDEIANIQRRLGA